MADLRLKPDPNGRNVIGAIDDSTGFIVPLYAANATGRLKVDASVTVSGLATAVTDGEAVDVADTGNLSLGTDGSNYQVLHTDSTGDLQVDLASALPAGTNAIGKLAANSGVDIGDVDVTSLNDGGNSITVDNTVLSVVGGGLEATAQRVTLASDSTGVLSVDDNGGALTVDGTVSLGAGVASIGILGANSGVDIGDVTINNASGGSAVNIQDGGNSITVDNAGTFAVQADTELPVAAALDDTTANPTVPGIGAFLMGWNSSQWERVRLDIGDDSVATGLLNVVGMMYDGATYDRFRGDSTNGLLVNLGANNDVSLNAGTNAIGKLAANSGVDIGDVDVTSIAAGTNLIGDVGIQPRTTNGLDTFMASGSDGSSILVATAQAVKASAGKVYGYYLYNPEAAVTFVHFYNTAQGSVTVGTTNPLFTLAIPAGSAANLMSEIGVTFGTAITIAATTTAGGNTAPATGVSAVIWYK